jgi:hypothetical protein
MDRDPVFLNQKIGADNTNFGGAEEDIILTCHAPKRAE